MKRDWFHHALLIGLLLTFASIPLLHALSGYEVMGKLSEDTYVNDIPMIKRVDLLIQRNRDRANAVRGLLLYHDPSYTREYYHATSEIHRLRNQLQTSPDTPGTLLDLLDKNQVWELQIEAVFRAYENGSAEDAIQLAENSTKTTQTLLEDLERVKQELYDHMERDMINTRETATTFRKTSLSLALLSSILILVTVVFFFRRSSR